MSTWIVCWFSKKLQYVLKHVYYIHPEMKISLPKCWVRYAGSTFYHWWNHVFFHQSLVFITRRGSRMCYIYIQVNGHLIFLYYFLPLILVVVFVVILSVLFFSTWISVWFSNQIEKDRCLSNFACKILKRKIKTA